MASARRVCAVAILIVLVTIAGCSGGGELDDAEPAGGDGDLSGATTTPMATAGPDDAADESAAPGVVQDRARIRTATVELEVGDFDAARRNLSEAVSDYGGYVSDGSERLNRVDNETYTTGVIVLRVPREEYTAMVERVREGGTVLAIDEDSQDVTEQLVDIEARLDNLEAQRDRLRALYEDANDTRDVLQIEERLTEVQTEIERLEARQQSLERQVALSTIRVELREPRPEPDTPDREQWYDTGVLTAFFDSVSGVVVTGRALAVAFAYALPYLVVFGGPLVVLGVGLRRWRRRRVRRIDETDLQDAGDDDSSTPDGDDE